MPTNGHLEVWKQRHNLGSTDMSVANILYHFPNVPALWCAQDTESRLLLSRWNAWAMKKQAGLILNNVTGTVSHFSISPQQYPFIFFHLRNEYLLLAFKVKCCFGDCNRWQKQTLTLGSLVFTNRDPTQHCSMSPGRGTKCSEIHCTPVPQGSLQMQSTSPLSMHAPFITMTGIFLVCKSVPEGCLLTCFIYLFIPPPFWPLNATQAVGVPRSSCFLARPK